MKNKLNHWAKTLSICALLGLLAGLLGCSVSASTPVTSAPTMPAPSVAQPASSTTKTADSPKSAPNIISVVVVGTITHGPMQPTIKSIKEVLAKYGDKVNATWIDMSTKDGDKYAKDHNLAAHLNILINNTYKYNVNGKDIEFQWFEGQLWTKQDLDAVLSNLLNK